jgi:tRNA-splicing ligase RtcB/release factor H-coupled RctB family protein
MYLKVSKNDWLKPFDKNSHYRAFDKASQQMTDEGLGGGNHFLSIEEDDEWVYIICHTGSRNLGIALYQSNYELVHSYARDCGWEVANGSVALDFLPENYWAEYEKSLQYAVLRRKQFVLKTMIWLQVAGYIRSNKSEIPSDYMNMHYDHHDMIGKQYGCHYMIADSIHNHLRRDEMDRVIHRKGSTELKRGEPVVIPLSMTRGSLIVKSFDDYGMSEALYSCSHGAGRKLSRFDAMKHWRTVLKEKERKQYREQFSELLDKSGEFPSGYLQEFDYAYKDSDEILTMQPYLKKVTQTRPIVTVKFTEI